MTTIIVPVADTRPQCKQYLEDFLQSYIVGGYKANGWGLVLCFDGCEDEFIQYFKDKYWNMLGIGFIVSPIRRGFAPNSNKGLKHVHKELKTDCFLINMDTILPHSSYLRAGKNSGLCSMNQVHIEGANISEKILRLNESQSVLVKRDPSTKFTGFCMYLSKELMDQIGYLDESFVASFEEDDLIARALLRGLPVEVVNINVHHYIKDRKEVSNTGAYDLERLGKNLLKFRYKWRIPGNIEHVHFNQWIKENHVWCEEMRED